MKKILKHLLFALKRGQDVILARIIENTGSAPRTSGARMLVLHDGKIFGSVGGGELEGICRDCAKKLLNDTNRHQIISFDLSADKAANTGMICGGAVKVLLQRITPADQEFFRTLNTGGCENTTPLMLTIMTENNPPRFAKWFKNKNMEELGLPASMEDAMRKAAEIRHPSLLQARRLLVFAEPLISPATLHLVGAGHISISTAQIADMAGFEVIVMDDRAEYANIDRFPAAREVRELKSFDGCLHGLGKNDFVVIVTRGHLHDRCVLEQALRTEAGYIGMIGSRSKRDAIYCSLREAGYNETDLDRVFCPIGVKIGADTPEEIGISIVAELIRVRAGVTEQGAPLL
jgi:xanthine dehydrogenase accessory factor